jgi:hypothetical protein
VDDNNTDPARDIASPDNKIGQNLDQVEQFLGRELPNEANGFQHLQTTNSQGQEVLYLAFNSRETATDLFLRDLQMTLSQVSSEQKDDWKGKLATDSPPSWFTDTFDDEEEYWTATSTAEGKQYTAFVDKDSDDFWEVSMQVVGGSSRTE